MCGELAVKLFTSIIIHYNQLTNSGIEGKQSSSNKAYVLCLRTKAASEHICAIVVHVVLLGVTNLFAVVTPLAPTVPQELFCLSSIRIALSAHHVCFTNGCKPFSSLTASVGRIPCKCTELVVSVDHRLSAFESSNMTHQFASQDATARILVQEHNSAVVQIAFSGHS
jgi:hypothetical protein